MYEDLPFSLKNYLCYLKDLKDRYILIPAYTEPFSG